MKKSNVIVDVDGIILDFLTPFIDYLNKIHGYSLRIDDIKNYNIESIIEREKTDFYFNIYMHFLTHFYPEKFEYINGALDFFNRLSTKFNLYLITALDPSKKEHRKNNLKDLKYKELIFEKNKQKYIKKLNPVYIFEDSPDLINSYIDNKYFKGDIFVPSYPYNRNNLKNYNNIIYYHTFEEVIFSIKWC